MRIRRFLAVSVLLASLAGCSGEPVQTTESDRATPLPESNSVATAQEDLLVQYSLITALAAGDYDNGMPLGELLKQGDFGLGTFDRLAGELILLDGEMYQALADGVIRRADLAGGTPFATVTTFAEDGRIENVAAASLEDLDKQLDRKLPRRNSPYAMRIDGEFRKLTLRSVPTQQPPFKPLAEVVKQRSTWDRENVRGTLIGLRYPHWIGTLNVAGYHWHFISDDRTFGGHVLDGEFRNGVVCYDECSGLVIHVPTLDFFESFDASSIGEREIDTIERQRASSPMGED